MKKSAIWEIFLGPKNKNLVYLFPIFIPHLLTAILEGGSFGLIYLAFCAIDSGTNSPSSIDILNQWTSGFTAMQTFYFYIFSAIIFQSVRGLLNFLALYGTSLFSLEVQRDTQKRIYHQIFQFSFPFVSQYKIGDLSEYAKTPSLFIPTLFEAINRFSVSFFICLGLTFTLCWISPSLTLLTVILFMFFILFQKTLIKKVVKHSKQLTDHLFEFSHQTVQSLQGIRPIHVFSKKKFILDRIEKLLGKIVISSKKAHFWNNMIPTISETVNVLLVGTILMVGSFILARPGMTVLPNLLTYIALTYRLATRLQIAMSAAGAISLHYGSIIRLNEIIDSKDKEFDPVGGIRFTHWQDKIEFKNVSLQYKNTKTPSLRNISFQIDKGSVVALVGLSGSGKSSILDLFLSLYTPTSGSILVDSKPLQDYSHESWRNQIGVVSQDSFIFNGTIEENIRFGDQVSSIEKVHEAAKLAGASEFILHLPENYSTVVGERGYKLSGGERQRIALARALLKNPEILVLDEFTSNLDSHSEKIIQRSIETLEKTKTVIIVAHRLSTIMNADQILVLEKGQIIERGKHDALLLQNGRYANLWELQSVKAFENETALT